MRPARLGPKGCLWRVRDGLEPRSSKRAAHPRILRGEDSSAQIPAVKATDARLTATNRLSLADYHRRPRRARSRDRRFGKQRTGVRDQHRDLRPGYASSETFAVCNSDTQVSRPRQSCAASIADMACTESPDSRT
jgi:hypothetical protein